MKFRNKIINQAFAVFSKEVKCICRDKKSFIFSIIVPLILLPLLLTVLTSSMDSMEKQVSNDIKISINNENNQLHNYLSNFPDIKFLKVDDAKKSLEQGDILLNVIVRNDLDEAITAGQNSEVILESNNSSLKSQVALSKVSEYIKSYNNLNAETILTQKGIPVQVLNQIIITTRDISIQKAGVQNIYFSLIIPMLLVVYCCMGSISTATDLSAGEKERNTLEPLLSTGANRISIIIGKIAATTLLGIISGCSAVLGMVGFTIISQSQSKVSLSFLQIATLMGIIILISVFFASVNLSIGIYSRTYKEAQTYMTVLPFICLVPSYMAYALELSDITLMHMSIPILNIICVIKETLAGVFNANHFLILTGWLVLYITLSYILAVKLFKKEKVIFRI